MQRLHTFSRFVNEEKVPLSEELEEFTVQNEGDGKFSFEKSGTLTEFTVLPLPSNAEGYEGVFFMLTSALESNRPSELYNTLEKIQALPYKFGGIIPATLSLENVPNLGVSLQEKQRAFMKTSPIKFLRSEFGSFSKELKGATMSYLKKRAQLYGVVLECMFYYIRSQKTAKDEN